MGEGTLTKIIIALIAFGFVIGFVTTMMTSLGNEYGRTIESQYKSQYTEVNSDLREVHLETVAIEKGSTIDESSQDVAQLEGILSAGRKESDAELQFKDVITDTQKVLPFDNELYGALVLIIGTIILGAVFAFVRGRWA